MQTDSKQPDASPGSAPLGGSVKCFCRKCRQEKREDEMFAGIIHPDGIGRGVCRACLEKEKSAEPATIHEAIGNWMVRKNGKVIALCTNQSDAELITSAINSQNVESSDPRQ